MERGKNQETTDTRKCSVKELSHFVDQFHQLPEKPLPKWIMRVTNLETVSLSLVLGKSMFGLTQGPQVTMKQSPMSICDSDRKQVLPKGTASLVDWVKCTERSIYPEKKGCPSPPLNVK